MNIDEMPAGREMDVLVAERVMGWGYIEPRIWSVVPACAENSHMPRRGPLSERTKRLFVGPDKLNVTEIHDWPVSYTSDVVPHYSTDITDAWEVVEKLQSPVVVRKTSLRNNTWVCTVWTYDGIVARKRTEEHADTAPLAICRAALKAVYGN